MAMPSIAANLLVMSLQISCPPMPVSDSDSGEVEILAREIVPDRLSAVSFEEIAVSKCATSFVSSENQEHRSETVSFIGYFPNKSQEADTVVRDTVLCRKTESFVEGGKRRIERNCSLIVETRLKYDGITEPIKIPQGIAVEDVRQFLSFLSRQVGTSVEGQVFTNREFSQISSIMGSTNRSRKHLSAVYESGCSSSWIKVTAVGDKVLEFGPLQRRSAIC